MDAPPAGMPLDADAARARLLAAADDALRPALDMRWARHGDRLLRTLQRLYGADARAPAALDALLRTLGDCARARPSALRALDAARERDPRWFLGADMIGYSAYVDRFGGTLAGVAERVPHLQALGVRYLHLLPFQRARDGDSDGGFAVRDYEAVEPRLGTLDDLDALTTRLREGGISLCADFVLNHTADDHAWARAARAGDAHYRDYYLVYPDRTRPDAFERTLAQVFPQTAPGNFTHVPGLGWVWTTFYPYQWDLDWSNPHVFAEMAGVLLRTANRGVEAFRLDSTAYLWKREGTASMNLPEAHAILQALRALVAIVAPGVLLKAEAIVPTRALPPYFGDGDARGAECHLAYHSSLMAAAWAGLAERRGDIVRRVLDDTPPLPPGCGWMTYVRCHDDIGWGVLREEAAGDGAGAGFDLARVARFFAGDAPGSYARGRGFQAGDPLQVHGTNGMTAALVGIDAARDSGDSYALALAERRLRLMLALALGVPGVPLLYMGDEFALGNDEGYARDPARAGEGRWLHRPAMPWDALDADPVARRAREAIGRLIATRRGLDALAADAPIRTLPQREPALLAFARGDAFIALHNFGDAPVAVDAATLPGRWRDAIDGAPFDPATPLPAYAVHWLVRA